MKTVFDSNEVAHIWATQSQNEGRNANNNFYFKGATIYSYGSHFPIATIQGNDVLFTLDSYSNTTSKHIQKARQAISHLNIIYCYDVPVKWSKEDNLKNVSYLSDKHEKNISHWKETIKLYFDELGNKRNRDIKSRVNSINYNIEELKKYVSYFGIKIKDKELLSLLKIAESDNFIEAVREAKEKAGKAQELKLKKAGKAYSKYLELWRKDDQEGIKNLDEKTKSLSNYYHYNSLFTRLRYNEAQNRVETSKGVQIPVEIAKRTFFALNGCFMNNCKELSIPVLSYEITESTKQYIKAGCHTIPNEDIKYIAELLKW